MLKLDKAEKSPLRQTHRIKKLNRLLLLLEKTFDYILCQGSPRMP
jgi:hypothetical protein